MLADNSVKCAVFLLLLLSYSTNGQIKTYIDDVLPHADEFGYTRDTGPATWSSRFESCAGRRQSPVNIEPSKAVTVDMPPLEWRGYWERRTEGFEFKNTKHAVEVTFSGHPPTLRGGPLDSEFELSQIHFHWGSQTGSEHALQNQFYGTETHFVHYKKSYGSIANASQKPDGLAVVAIFLKASDRNNTDMVPMVSGLQRVREGGSNSTLPGNAMFWLRSYLDTEHYYTYQGSLTTPPCSEVVTWIVMEHLGNVGHKQIEEFQKLRGQEGRIVDNRRPLQPLNGRTVQYYAGEERSNIFFPQ